MILLKTEKKKLCVCVCVCVCACLYVNVMAIEYLLDFLVTETYFYEWLLKSLWHFLYEAAQINFSQRMLKTLRLNISELVCGAERIHSELMSY